MAEKTNAKMIRIYGKEKTKEDGSKYVEYSYTKDGETFYRVSFTNECMIRPTKPGYWLLNVDRTTVSLKKAQKKVSKEGREYFTNPVMFIGCVLEVPTEDTEYAKQVLEMKQAEVDALLGD